MEVKNHINDVRKRIRAAFSEQNIVDDAGQEFVSPNGRYRIKQTVFQQSVDKWNWRVSRIEVFDRDGNLVSSFLIDDDNFFHLWILAGENEYLLYAENMCGGNSVLNLKTREIQSYSDGTDGFIFADYLPSPDLSRMAIVGCVWAHPYEVRVFDISNIESLPWPMVLKTELEEEESEDVIWVDNNTIRISEYPREGLVVSRDVVVNS